MEKKTIINGREVVGWITRKGKHIPIFDDKQELDEIKKNLKVSYTGINVNGTEYQVWLDSKTKTRFVVYLQQGGYKINEAFVPQEYRRKGIATWFYNKMEKISLKKTGKGLVSSKVLTPLGKKFWEGHKWK